MGRQAERMPMLSSTIVQTLMGTSDPVGVVSGVVFVVVVLIGCRGGVGFELFTYSSDRSGRGCA